MEAPRLFGSLADTHAHLQMLSDPAWSLVRSAYYDVSFICDITDPSDGEVNPYDALPLWCHDACEHINRLAREGVTHSISGELLALPSLRIAAGVHPHNAKCYDRELEVKLLRQLSDPRTAALGEVGLDYHYDFSTHDEQRRVFARQIELAHTTGLPLILHMREAHDEGFALLEEYGWPQAGVLLHCFNLDPETLKPWLERDCYVAFGGPVTFKNAPEVAQSALEVPLDRLLTETDSPYMAPEPLRGIACSPEFTLFTAKRLCNLFDKQTSNEQTSFLNQLYTNAQRLLNRAPSTWQQVQGEELIQ
ncbi:MAG: TatD family hydrolase [Eggerthellaceae bacterium]|nr:TatD family hydrolase [Eggerthellaceae bacterium]